MNNGLNFTEDFLIEVENQRFKNPFKLSRPPLFVSITDDHAKHIKAHFKYLWNPLSWFHFIQHLRYKKLKKTLGITHITNEHLLSVMKEKTQSTPEISKKKVWH